MSSWTRKRQPLRLESLMRAQVLLLLPVAGGFMLTAFAATFLNAALAQPGRFPSPAAVPVFILGTGVGTAIVLLPLWELVRFFRRPPAKYPNPVPDSEHPPAFPGIEAFGPLLRVSTAIAAGRAYVISGGASAVGVVTFAAVLASRSDGPPPSIEGFGAFLVIAIGLLLLAWSGRSRLRMRVWVFQNGLACRSGGQVTALKWAEIKWLVTTVGAAVWPDERETELGTGDGREIRLPAELDDPDAVAEFVVELAHQNIYPRLLAAMERGREVAFGDIWLCAHGIRRSENEDVIPWSRIGQIAFAWGTHVVVMKRDAPLVWVQLLVRTTPNVWLFLWLTEVLHPLQTAPPTLARPWMRLKPASE